MLPRFSPKPKGFTLIELLIVVAIIAILAAIAVPNFLEAQARSRISREKSDLRSIATALESYAVDNNVYPPHGEVQFNNAGAFVAIHYPGDTFQAGLNTWEFIPGFPITTPVAYLSSLPEDPTLTGAFIVNDLVTSLYRRYGMVQSEQMRDTMLAKTFLPPEVLDNARLIPATYGGWRLYAGGPDGDRGYDTKQNIPYDPTNGTVSDGDIIRSQKYPDQLLTVDE